MAGVRAAELARDEAREANRQLNKDMAETVKRSDGLRLRVDSLLEKRTLLQSRLDAAEQEFREMNTDRDNCRRDYLAMRESYDQMVENLFNQARLAGAIAEEARKR